MNERSQKISRAGWVGASVNAFLAAVKIVIGYVTGAVSISADGINSLSDSASSVITLISAKLAAKPADKKHPYGYGRTEYLSAALISLLVLYAGISALQDAITSILHPQAPDYTPLSLWILAGALLIKLLLGIYTSRQGKALHSDSLIASGQDALSDCLLSAAVIICALIEMFFHISLGPWAALIISFFVLKNGYDLLKNTFSEILGEREDPELIEKVNQTILSVDGVQGSYDLFFHDYGPDRHIASVHIEVPDTMSAAEIDRLERQVASAVYEKNGIILAAVGIYCSNTSDAQAARMKEQLTDLICQFPGVLQIHGIYISQSQKQIMFDVVISFDVENRSEVFQEIVQAVKQKWPDYQVHATLDVDAAVSE